MSHPTSEGLEPQELLALKSRIIANQLSEDDLTTLEACIDLILLMDESLVKKQLSIRKLKAMLYGEKTEKTKPRPRKAAHERTRKKTSDRDPRKRRAKGRLGADAYKNAVQIDVPHPDLGPGQGCPLCPGRLYLLEPARKIQLTGHAPVQANCYNLQRLRCSSCQEVFTAPNPETLKEEGKYTSTACAMVCLLKYGMGLPLNRMDDLQAWLGIPLPSSTQFDMIEGVIDAVHPVFQTLTDLAANADLLHTDDTSARVLSLIKENQEQNPKRKGIHTTGIVARVNNHDIVRYTTGRSHAGENLETLLDRRIEGLPPPIHMADALSHNFDHPHPTHEANCLAHGRRQFYELETAFPNEAGYVLDILARVYANDALAQDQNLTPQQRLIWHQSRSAPQMKKLKTWLCILFEERQIEPNSSIGGAVTYLLKHWDRLTLFLREPGVPLDNNICERALKKFVRLRKNSLFYKNEFGALVGDILLTLIHTCVEAGENPFDYLTALQQYREAVASDPTDWLPWNYRDTLDGQDKHATAA